MKYQRGFTLIELIVAVFAVGVLSIIMSPALRGIAATQNATYIAQQSLNNQLIGTALLNAAHDGSQLGTLVTPYTASGFTNAVYSTGYSSTLGLAVIAALSQSGVNQNAINTDGYSTSRVRVYQLVSGLTMTVPLYFQSGPLVNLAYQYGAIYQTACPFANSTCNPTAATGIPGTSPVMSAANFTTWTTTGSDLAPFFVSTLPLQKQMLATTAQRLDHVRDSLLNFLRVSQASAAGNDATNWYPPSSASLGGQTPGTNQGCRDGWYSLDTNATILPTVGLAQSEYGVTAWGGPIQYCRDYDPLGTKTANASPHFAAIRINANVSQGIGPDTAVLGNNIVLTF